MLGKASHLIPDLISFVLLYVYVQPHLCNLHSLYQQWHVALTFLIILYFLTLFSTMLNFYAWYPLKMSMCLEMGLGCSFQFKYKVQYFSNVGTGLLGLNQYKAIMCLAQLHSDAGEA